MNDLMVVEKLAHWEKLKALVLDSVSSPITKRVYNMALDEFMAWFQQAPRPGFTKATVSAWRVSLEERELGSSSIIIRMSAIRKLAAEAADNGLLAPELAAGIARVKSAKTQGIRTGNWLSQRQAQALLSAPDITTLRGLRDRAILAVLLGCGLRRSEVAALTFGHLQQRDGRWCIVDLVGKHGRVRTAPMPTWVKVAIDAWASPAGVAEGYVFRSVNRADRVTGERGILAGRGDELRERHLQVGSEADQTVERNAVRTVFIFLYLLESQVEMLGHFALGLAGGATGEANIASEIPVERTFGQAFFVVAGHGVMFSRLVVTIRKQGRGLVNLK